MGDTFRGFGFYYYGTNFLKYNSMFHIGLFRGSFGDEIVMTSPMQKATQIPPGCGHLFGRLVTLAEVTPHLTGRGFDPQQQSLYCPFLVRSPSQCKSNMLQDSFVVGFPGNSNNLNNDLASEPSQCNPAAKATHCPGTEASFTTVINTSQLA